MKTFFCGYGYRETKHWTCPHCNNFHACGMDLMVDKSAGEHLAVCPRGVLRQIEKIAETIADYAHKELFLLILKELHSIRAKIGATCKRDIEIYEEKK